MTHDYTYTNPYCNPKRLMQELNAYVMGQDAGTRTVATAVAQHLMNISYPSDAITTDNVLIVGPTGCGKTETVRVLQRLEKVFRCPVIMVNIMDYSPAKSWIGRSVTNIFDTVAMRAADIYFEDHDKTLPAELMAEEITEIANRAIIVIDEFDKIAMRHNADGTGENRSFHYDYQSNLLKIIEGNSYELSDFTLDNSEPVVDPVTGELSVNTKKTELTDITLDSSNMLFIMMGAFDGIRDITVNRLLHEQLTNGQKTRLTGDYYQDTCCGFMAQPRSKCKPVQTTFTDEQLIPSQEDLIQYGFMRELVGRIPVRTVYKPLTEEALINIMLHAKTSAYREYQQRFRRINQFLRCDHDALRRIAHTAVERGTGARGLRNVFSELLTATWYELAGDNLVFHVLLRGRDMAAGRPPLLHDKTESVRRKNARDYERWAHIVLPQRAQPNSKKNA